MGRDNSEGVIVLLVIASAFLFIYNNPGLMSLAELTTSISFPPDNLVHSVSFEDYRADVKVYAGSVYAGSCKPSSNTATCGVTSCGVDANGCTIYALYLKGSYVKDYRGYNMWSSACTSTPSGCGSGGGGSATTQVCKYDYALYKNNVLVGSANSQGSSFLLPLDSSTLFIFGESTIVNSVDESISNCPRDSNGFLTAACSYTTVSKPIPPTCENVIGRFLFKVPEDKYVLTINPPATLTRNLNSSTQFTLSNNFRSIKAAPCLTYNFNLLGDSKTEKKCYDNADFNVGTTTMQVSLDTSLPTPYTVIPSIENIMMTVNGESKNVGSIIGKSFQIGSLNEVQQLQIVGTQLNVTETDVQKETDVHNDSAQQIQGSQAQKDWLQVLIDWIRSVFAPLWKGL